MKNIPLHLKIIIALILGTIFGVIFSVPTHEIIITFKEDSKQSTVNVESWDEISFWDDEHELVNFNKNEQVPIIKFFEKNFEKSTIHMYVNKGSDTKSYHNVLKIQKKETIATIIKPIGTLFIRLLSFIAIPLVVASLVIGAASLGDVRKLGRIGGKTFLIYIITTAVAISIGLGVANIIEPGKKIDPQTKERLLGTYHDDKSGDVAESINIDVVDFLVNIVPKNPIEALTKGSMLQIVFFSVMFGLTLTFIEKDKSKPVIDFFEGVSATMIKMVDIIMLLAPYGVFALIAATIASFGFDILSTLVWYTFAVIFGLLIQTTFVYAGLVKFMGGMRVMDFFKGVRNAQAIAFSTSSSAATLPITIDCVEKNLGVKKEISGFVLPLGATINMDGTALYQGVAAVFIAQVYGFDLGVTEQLTIVLTAVLASIGTAPVPGVGLIMLIMILNAINVPGEGIALILGVDRILDMLRTVTNVTGDSAVTVAINGSES